MIHEGDLTVFTSIWYVIRVTSWAKFTVSYIKHIEWIWSSGTYPEIRSVAGVHVPQRRLPHHQLPLLRRLWEVPGTRRGGSRPRHLRHIHLWHLLQGSLYIVICYCKYIEYRLKWHLWKSHPVKMPSVLTLCYRSWTRIGSQTCSFFAIPDSDKHLKSRIINHSDSVWTGSRDGFSDFWHKWNH